MAEYTVERGKGYEVSTKGDKRFSPFNAILPDGRSIETTYQCDTKRIQPGGTGTAIRLASLRGIPVFNLRNPTSLEKLKQHVNSMI